VALGRWFALLDSAVGSALVGSEVGAQGRPTSRQKRAHAAVLLRFRVLEVWNRGERAVAACASEAYGRCCSGSSWLLSRTSASSSGRSWCLGLGGLAPSALANVRLVIFGGCLTANTGGRGFGNLVQSAKRLGVGSVIAFRNDINYPAPGPKASQQGGNYFWARFAVYVRRGSTIGTAIHQAQGDLLKQSGRAKTKYGFDSAVIGGASAHPASLRLTIKGSRASAAGDHVIKRDQHGDVVSFGAPSTTAGARRLSVVAARAVATRFLTQQAPHVASAGLRVVSQGAAGLAPGEELESFTYRSRLGDVPGPALAQVEVDLRSGKVIFEAARRVTPSSTRFLLTVGQAKAAARAAVRGRGAVLSTKKDVWSYPRWAVTLKAPGGGSATVELNAADGHVAGISYADPSS